MHFQPVSVGAEPVPDLGILVIRGIILNQNGSLVTIGPRQLLEESQVRRSVEGGIVSVMEAGLPEFDGAQNLDTFTLPGDRNFRRLPDAAPGGVQGGVLAEAGFVGEEQRPVLAPGFFLRLG